MPHRFFAVLAAMLAACGHGEPFVPGDYASNDPFNPPPFVRLTLNPARDVAPSWLPDGRIMYTMQRIDRSDLDLCLALQPGTGGAISRYLCPSTAPDDSINALLEGSASNDGRLAYVRQSARRFPFVPLTPDAQALVVGSLERPTDVRVLRPIAYTAPWGRLHQGISYIRWVGPHRLVYRADSVTYPRACSGCPPDTVRTGLELVTVDFSGSTPVLAAVPGTDGATSVDVGSTGDTIYYTRAGNTRVFTYTFSSAATDTVFDFATLGVPVDLSIRGAALVAAVGNDLAFVMLPAGTPTVVTDPEFTHQFRRPAFSPDGSRVVVEARSQSGLGSADIWLVTAP